MLGAASMELMILVIFASSLILCIFMHASVLYALFFGFLLFFTYSLCKGNSFSCTLQTCMTGIWTVKTILIAFVLIGMLTASWRAAGTIPAIIAFASTLINPKLMLWLTFLLSSLVSFMTGTAFGTSATMGVICYSIACSMGIHPAIAGGAMISGAFFGDRCSPVSTSAMLVAEVTQSNIYDNIKYMVRTSLVPFAGTCIIYLGLGCFARGGGTSNMDAAELFSREFTLGLIPLLPAVTVILLACFKIDVKTTMAASIVAAALVYLFYQHGSPADGLQILLKGYTARDEGLHGLIDGGGISSMFKVALIVSISASYSGLFKLTGILGPLERLVLYLGKKAAPFTVMLPLTTFICMIACNQTLAIMLGNELVSPLEENKQRRAIYLENSAVVIAALIPWSIASTVPLTTCGAPTRSLTCACYLYLVPLWTLVRSKAWEKGTMWK